MVLINVMLPKKRVKWELTSAEYEEEIENRSSNFASVTRTISAEVAVKCDIL